MSIGFTLQVIYIILAAYVGCAIYRYRLNRRTKKMDESMRHGMRAANYKYVGLHEKAEQEMKLANDTYPG
jgi:UPF0716 family protein affecting phage T7 exclusion